MIHKTTSYEWRVAYISDGSVEEVWENSEAEARNWLGMVDMGAVEGVEPGDAFLQRRKVITMKDSNWESVLD